MTTPTPSLAEPTTLLLVEVVVTGAGSEPDDESLPGTYLHEVTLTRPVAPSALTEPESGAIAQEVLDSFHEHQGIDCLDDFSISVRIAGGQSLSEMDDEDLHDTQLVATVEHCGKS